MITLAEAQARVDRTAHDLAQGIDKIRAEHEGLSYAAAASILKRKHPELREAYALALMEFTAAAAGGPIGANQAQAVRS